MIWKHRSGEFDLSQRGIIMGILNVTPDSFSDGGTHHQEKEAIEHALLMESEGASIIDIGGESTRPGAKAITEAEELRRTISVIEGIRQHSAIPISIDTTKPEVAKQAVEAGAEIINDISGFTNPEMIKVAAEYNTGCVIMHRQGTPDVMQKAPHYENVVDEVKAFFTQQIETMNRAGIDREYLCIDPGIGFGKSLDHNKSLIQNTSNFCQLGVPVLMGLSRKSFISKVLEEDALSLRDWPTCALTSLTRGYGAQVHRVHQVKENCDALRMAEAILL